MHVEILSWTSNCHWMLVWQWRLPFVTMKRLRWRMVDSQTSYLLEVNDALWHHQTLSVIDNMINRQDSCIKPWKHSQLFHHFMQILKPNWNYGRTYANVTSKTWRRHWFGKHICFPFLFSFCFTLSFDNICQSLH